MRYLIAYVDGSIFEGHPSDAPPVGVVCIVQTTKDSHRPHEVVRRYDWYWYRPDEDSWYGGDIHGLLDQAMRLGAMWPKQGRTLQNQEYENICKSALNYFLAK